MSRLDWERHRRQSAVWQRGAEPASRDLYPPASKSEGVKGYVAQRRYSEPQESGRRVRAAGNRKAPLVPIATRRSIYVQDWANANRLLIEEAAKVESGRCFVVQHGRRQILFGKWDQRFVAVANHHDLKPKQKQGLDLAGFRPQTETFHKGTWFVYHRTITDHSRQAWLICEVLRDAWRLRMPATLIVGEAYLKASH